MTKEAKHIMHCVFLDMENNNNDEKAGLLYHGFRKWLYENSIFVCFSHFCWLCSLIQCVYVTHNITQVLVFFLVCWNCYQTLRLKNLIENWVRRVKIIIQNIVVWRIKPNQHSVRPITVQKIRKFFANQF